MLYNKPVDEAEFDRYYREIHIPLASKLPGLRRYTMSRNPAGVRGDSYYLIAELDWDDMAALQAAFASPEGKAAADDVPKFATGGSSSVVFEVEDLL